MLCVVFIVNCVLCVYRKLCVVYCSGREEKKGGGVVVCVCGVL